MNNMEKWWKMKKKMKFPLNNVANWWEIEKKCETPIEYHRMLLQRPQICPLRMYKHSSLCPTGHRPFGAAALLSLLFFSHHSKQGIGYRWPCAILGWLNLYLLPHFFLLLLLLLLLFFRLLLLLLLLLFCLLLLPILLLLPPLLIQLLPPLLFPHLLFQQQRKKKWPRPKTIRWELAATMQGHAVASGNLKP